MHAVHAYACTFECAHTRQLEFNGHSVLEGGGAGDDVTAVLRADVGVVEVAGHPKLAGAVEHVVLAHLHACTHVTSWQTTLHPDWPFHFACLSFLGLLLPFLLQFLLPFWL